MRVLNLSGGHSSAMMVILEYRPGDIVIFADTGREHPATYSFIDMFEDWEKIPVVRVRHSVGDAFGALVKRKKFLPNRMKRICTVELKVLTIRRHLVSLGIRTYENFIGFRADEKRRVDSAESRWLRVFNKFPLFDKGITKGAVDLFWEKKPYRLAIPRILGNCDLCFMKGRNALLAIMREFPELADKWIEDELQSGYTFLEGVSYSELLRQAKYNLFSEYPLDRLSFEFSCGCSS